jgi:hypothetical protein
MLHFLTLDASILKLVEQYSRPEEKSGNSQTSLKNPKNESHSSSVALCMMGESICMRETIQLSIFSCIYSSGSESDREIS